MERLPAVKTPPVAAKHFLMPFPSGGRNDGAQPGITDPVQGAGFGIGRAALGAVQAARVHHGAAFGAENAVVVFPAAAKKVVGSQGQAAQQPQGDHHPRVQQAVGHQVFRPGMVGVMNEGFRTDGVLRHIRKLAYVFFPHVPERPGREPLLYGNGFFHGLARMRGTPYRQVLPRFPLKKPVPSSIKRPRRNREGKVGHARKFHRKPGRGPFHPAFFRVVFPPCLHSAKPPKTTSCLFMNWPGRLSPPPTGTSFPRSRWSS